MAYSTAAVFRYRFRLLHACRDAICPARAAHLPRAFICLLAAALIAIAR